MIQSCDKLNRILVGDAVEQLKTLPDELFNCCITSPPYWGLRDYGVDGQIGLESAPMEFVGKLVAVFREVRRVLRNDGTLWLNIGDCYAAARGGTGMPAETLAGGVHGHGDEDSERGRGKRGNGSARRDCTKYGLKHKDLVGIPWRLAFALQADGWYLRSDIIWHKPNPMPESVTDRPTKAHEYVFLLTKSERYYYDAEAVKEKAKDWSSGGPGEGILPTTHYHPDNGGNAGLSKLAARYKDGDQPLTRNRRSVWTIPTESFSEAHFATFPEALVQPCLLAGSPEGGQVLDPFMGAGTTALVALKAGRKFVGVELNPEYAAIAEKRIWQEKNQATLI